VCAVHDAIIPQHWTFASGKGHRMMQFCPVQVFISRELMNPGGGGVAPLLLRRSTSASPGTGQQDAGYLLLLLNLFLYFSLLDNNCQLELMRRGVAPATVRACTNCAMSLWHCWLAVGVRRGEFIGRAKGFAASELLPLPACSVIRKHVLVRVHRAYNVLVTNTTKHISLRVPIDVLEKFQAEAWELDRSRNWVIVRHLSEAVGYRKPTRRPIKNGPEGHPGPRTPS